MTLRDFMMIGVPDIVIGIPSSSMTPYLVIGVQIFSMVPYLVILNEVKNLSLKDPSFHSG